MERVKALILNGSPRRGGGTSAASRLLAAGLEAGLGPGSAVEVLDLADLRILPCRGCRLCFDRGEDACPLEDDLAWLTQSLLESDIIVLASPVYVDAMSGLMKTVVDRLAWLCHRPGLGGKLGFVLTTTGSADSGRAKASLAQALRFWGARSMGSLGILAGARLSPEGLEAARPRLERAARGLSRAALAGLGDRPGFLALLVFQVQRRAWLRQAEASLDLDWWSSRGLLERGRAWLTPRAKAFPPSLAVARCAASIIALGMWGPRKARRGPRRGP
jgi:multimeric flavodoxin WrbA